MISISSLFRQSVEADDLRNSQQAFPISKLGEKHFSRLYNDAVIKSERDWVFYNKRHMESIDSTKKDWILREQGWEVRPPEDKRDGIDREALSLLAKIYGFAGPYPLPDSGIGLHRDG